MWPRLIGGLLCCVVGGVWIAQGIGVLHGSFMTGDGLYTVLGVLLALFGLRLLLGAAKARTSRAATERTP